MRCPTLFEFILVAWLIAAIAAVFMPVTGHISVLSGFVASVCTIWLIGRWVLEWLCNGK